MVGMFSCPPRPSMLPWIPPRFNSLTLPLNPWIQFLFLTFILCSPNTLSFKSLPMSPGCGDRTTILVSVKFPEVVGFWRRNIGFNYICFIWMGTSCWTIYLIMLLNVYCGFLCRVLSSVYMYFSSGLCRGITPDLILMVKAHLKGVDRGSRFSRNIQVLGFMLGEKWSSRESCVSLRHFL